MTEQTEQSVFRRVCYYVPANIDAEVRRSLRTMKRWEEINEGRHHEKRTSIRKTFASMVVLSATTPSSPEAVTFPVWSRNLSSSGVAVVCSAILEPLYTDNGPPPLKLSAILSEATSWQCGLCTTPNQFHWLDCQIARHRVLPGLLFDLGLEFLQKSNSFPSDLAPEFLGVLQSYVE